MGGLKPERGRETKVCELDFEAGNVKRAPHWMANAGLEWAYRMYKEPKRMFKRYVLEDWKFAKLFVKYW